MDALSAGARRDLWRERSLSGSAYRLGTMVVFGGLPAMLFVAVLVVAIARNGDWAFDFKQFWTGAHDVVHGRSPYPTKALLETSSDRLDPDGIQHVFRFPYPAATAVLLAPFGALPFQLAAALWGALLGIAVAAGLRLLGARDWRLYGLVFGTITVGSAVRLGTLTPALFLCLAFAWRYRDRRWIVAPLLAVAIVVKIFLWPLLAWLVATRRYAAAALTAGLAVVTTALGWALIGFDGFSLYPELIRRLTDVVAHRSYSLVALGTHLGLSESRAELLPFAVGLPVAALCVLVGRRERGDRDAFALAVLASLLLTPILWLHYFVLLLVPFALARPRLTVAWVLPLLFWLTPFQENEGALWRILFALGLSVVMVAMSLCKLPTFVRSQAPDAVRG